MSPEPRPEFAAPRLTVVGEVHPFEVGTWTRPSKVCYRRHRGPDGEFPG
jgi:hypothetical protein